ncbi:MFS transporter, partial [Amycolatopsis sp. NPDC000673]|uniref:MFS transporter n=1 Tax=Amycolatopsis sp. NPDC000673 TaxID=3154267 RepID=UPI0033343309
MTVSTDPRARHARWVAPLCWTAVALEGFDLVVLGVVLPALLKDKAWGLDPNTASLISAVGLLGVAVGAFAIGPLSDLFGRRGMMLLTVISFSVCTLLCAFARPAANARRAPSASGPSARRNPPAATEAGPFC